MYKRQGYSGAEMKAGDTTLSLRIGNPEENTCYLQATLQLEDGTVLYLSLIHIYVEDI